MSWRRESALTNQNAPLPGLPEGRENKWRSAALERPDLRGCPFCGQPPSLIKYVHPDSAARYQILCMTLDCDTVCGTKQQKSKEAADRIWESRDNVV